LQLVKHSIQLCPFRYCNDGEETENNQSDGKEQKTAITPEELDRFLDNYLQKLQTEKADRIFLNNLNTESNKRVFLLPSLTDFERYISTNDAIIIRLLISESPLQLVEGISTPTIEKVLVDIVGDVEFSFLQGSEINHVYTTIFERHNVNKNKLLRYATRRGRKEEVEQLINANKL
jgi:predicted aldo/keto reductase-like oxidoreductase